VNPGLNPGFDVLRYGLCSPGHLDNKQRWWFPIEHFVKISMRLRDCLILQS
jgi:hypothetical protein